MDTTPGAKTSATRHRDAICLAAHIVSESPGHDPAQLAASIEKLWPHKMWALVAGEAGLSDPDTATQALTVSLLRGAPVPAGGAAITAGTAVVCETALRRMAMQLDRCTPTPGTDQLAAQVRDALDDITSHPAPALRTEAA